MSDTVVAVAARVRELDALLARLVDGAWPGGTVPVSATGDPAPGPEPPGLPAGDFGAAWTAPFATVLRSVAEPGPVAVTGTDGPIESPVVDPVPGGRISQPFTLGLASAGEGHDGLDIAAPLGTPVRAMAAGVVRFAGRHPDGAVVVRVEHADGSQSWYAHLDPAVPVRVGDRVAPGQTVGRIGLTGRTTGPHLHLELWFGGRPIDPEPILRSGRLPGALAGPTDPTTALGRFDAVASTIPYAAEIRAAAVRAGIDPLLLAALVRTESGFRPDAVSRAGAMGLTQLMPATARSLGVADPFDPAANLEGGARYLAGNLRIFGRVDLALAAYQAGKAAVRRAGGIPDSPVTQGYVARVLETWSRYLAAAEGGQ
jgi:hypothetical protein